MSAELLPWLDAPLAQALRTMRGHALLVHGPQGVGQFELALAIAAAWLCEGEAAARPAGRACGRCTACHLIDAHTHPDLMVLLPEALQESLGWTAGDEAAEGEGGKGKKPSKDIKVEAVRAAVAFAQQTSSRGGDKVLLLFPSERMNATSANTLLKTLEEPPGRARFVLASAAPQRLLPTVRSRCQALRLAPPPVEAALAWLAAQGAERPEVLLAAAGGQPLEARDRLALGVDAEAWLRLPREVAAGQGATLAAWPLPLVVDALQKLCHDALARAVGAPARYFPAEALPARGDVERLTALGRTLREAARHAEHPWNAGLGVESLVLQTRRALHAAGAPHESPNGQGALATLRP